MLSIYKIFFVVFYGALAVEDIQPETVTESVDVEQLNVTFGLLTPVKRDIYQGYEVNHERVLDDVERDYPREQSITDIQYVPDKAGLQPIVRLSTKGNHSHVTSHFAFGQSAVKELSEQNSKLIEGIPAERSSRLVTRSQGSTVTTDSIGQVLASLFPEGIPEKYKDLVENDSGAENLNVNLNENLSTTTTSDKISDFKDSYPKDSYSKKPKDVKTQQNQKDQVSNNFESSPEVPKFGQRIPKLVSEIDVQQINRADESQSVEKKVRFLPTAVQSRNDREIYATEGQSAELIQTFGEPIIVDDRHNDNLIASSQDEGPSFIFAPQEISIVPSRERPFHFNNVDTEKQFNIEILDPDRRREHNNFKNSILKAAEASDLDSFQKIVENSFTIPDNSVTEAPSRTFLREFNEKTKKLRKHQEPTDRSFFVSTESSSQRREPMRISVPDDEFEEDSTKNDRFREDFSSSSAKPKKDEGRTFVEVQKAVNIQNLLIKEDADSIERHEEFIQPLAFGNKLTHRIESKFMKEKPWQSTGNNFELKDQAQNPRPQASSSSYSIRTFHPKLSEYRKQETKELNNFSKFKSSPHSSEDIINAKLSGIAHPAGQLHTKVTYENGENFDKYRQNFEDEHLQIHQQSVDVPVATKLIPQPYPVEKIVERPVIVENVVEKKVNVPYPVREIVEKIVERPVEIEKFVDRPFPVAVLVPYDRVIETPIHVPYPVEHVVEVEKIVEKPVPVEVHKIVDRPVPVQVQKIVEKFVDRPVPVHVKVNVPVKVPVPVHIPVAIHVSSAHKNLNHASTDLSSLNTLGQYKYINSQYHQALMNNLYSNFYNTHYGIPQQVQQPQQMMKVKEVSKAKQQQQFLKPAPEKQHQVLQQQLPHQQQPQKFQQQATEYQPQYQVQDHSQQYLQDERQGKTENQGYQAFAQLKDDYFGPVPIETEYSHWGGHHYKRSPNFGRNLRMEYGFKPPLIPSVEIDDQGLPIHRSKD